MLQNWLRRDCKDDVLGLLCALNVPENEVGHVVYSMPESKLEEGR